MNLKFAAAPMVNQSDLPFRILVGGYGATLVYTQMYIPEKLLSDKDYLDYHIRDLILGNHQRSQPVVAQISGNDPEIVVQAGRKLQPYCDAIDLNLGCPQKSAEEGHFGAYLLGQKDWPLVQDIVSAMSRSFTVPVSAKLRLCQPSSRTVDFAQLLEASGASWITLHARTVSARRRRQGPANLAEVKKLKENLRIPVISNGNVRVFDDLEKNLEFTGADGLMVGETLLENPCLFSGTLPDPVEISLEYLNICREFPVTLMSTIQTHIRHFVEFQCGRRPWFPKFRSALGDTTSLDAIEHLLCVKLERWRGRPPRPAHQNQDTLTPTLTDEESGQEFDEEENLLDFLGNSRIT